MKKNIWLIGILLVAAIGVGTLALSGKNREPVPSEVASGETTPLVSESKDAVTVSDQSTGDSMTIDSATLEDGGYVVIHEDADGKPGAIIGSSTYLPAETSEDIQLPLNRFAEEGEMLYAMLHSDDGNNLFQAVNDLPIKDSQGNIVVKKFTIGEESATATQASITSGNFFFRPATLSVNRGEVIVNVTQNSGLHTFVIDELGVKESLATGKTFSFRAESGTYEYYCDVPGHRQRGMLGTLTIN